MHFFLGFFAVLSQQQALVGLFGLELALLAFAAKAQELLGQDRRHYLDLGVLARRDRMLELVVLMVAYLDREPEACSEEPGLFVVAVVRWFHLDSFQDLLIILVTFNYLKLR